MKNQRIQETTKAQRELLVAKEEVEKILDTANNDANVTIIEADFKKEETLFTFKKQQDVLAEAKDKFNYDTNGIPAYTTNHLNTYEFGCYSRRNCETFTKSSVS